MLKPAEQGEAHHEERPVGELIQELVEEAKAYARAEVDLAKAIATAKAKALILPAILFGVAFICALAAITALAIGVVAALARYTGPVVAGLIGMLVFAGIAAGLGWYGAQRLKREL